MKKMIFVLISVLLLFGCIGAPAPGANVTTTNVTGPIPQLPSDNQSAQDCSPSYQFTELKTTQLSGSGLLSISATCAKNKSIAVYVNDVVAGTASIPADSATLNFNLIASRDGTNNVVVKSNGETVHSVKWTINPIGFLDTSSKDHDPISINHRKAVAFDVSNPIKVEKVGTYIRRQSVLTLGSNVLLEIRGDSSGEPGEKIADTSIPITSATLSPNWIYFPVSASLDKGRYWLIFSVDRENDYVNIHYAPIDKLAKGNADHLNMDLVKNEDTQAWEETSWEKLKFDRKYVFLVSSVSVE
jgi:hypothetical protein